MSDSNIETPLLTVAICTYNRSAYLIDTLRGLEAQRGEVAEVEVLVVNNNSSDATESLLRDWVWRGRCGWRWVSEDRQGLSYARNRALGESAAPWVLYIDDDVFVAEDFLESWLGFIRRHDRIAGGGGPIAVHFDAGRPRWFPMVLRQMLGYHAPYDAEVRYRGGDYPHGGNMLVDRELALRLGGFDPELGRKGAVLGGGEEKELFGRIRGAGGEVWYHPGAGLRHRIGAERLTREYVLGQARGMGAGDRRVWGAGVGVVRWGVVQGGKVLGTLVFALGYALIGQVEAASVLVRFRYELIKGFLHVQKTDSK
jgi:glucosyl-dolichyl phosphate glucuronosyltransferase